MIKNLELKKTSESDELISEIFFTKNGDITENTSLSKDYVCGKIFLLKAVIEEDDIGWIAIKYFDLIEALGKDISVKDLDNMPDEYVIGVLNYKLIRVNELRKLRIVDFKRESVDAAVYYTVYFIKDNLKVIFTEMNGLSLFIKKTMPVSKLENRQLNNKEIFDISLILGFCTLSVSDLNYIQERDYLVLDDSITTASVNYFSIDGCNLKIKVSKENTMNASDDVIEYSVENISRFDDGLISEQDIDVILTIELARQQISYNKISAIKEGRMIKLNKIVSNELVNILVNNKKIATGEIVDIDGVLGVKITKIK